MIRFALRCDHGHAFDSWFGSGADFDRLSGQGLLACAVCGSNAVQKELMAPAVTTAAPSSPPREVKPLSAPASAAEKALADLRRKIEATAEDVGQNFVTEARRIHEGEAPERMIIGEARPSEARTLLEEGVPVAPLPWLRSGKSN